jgi:hypothetical protein
MTSASRRKLSPLERISDAAYYLKKAADKAVSNDIPTDRDVQDLEEVEVYSRADFPCPSYYQA